MAAHRFRVRRNTPEGLQVVGFFNTLAKARTFATNRMRETGSVFRIERKPPMGLGWETALELVPEVSTPVEGAIARGRLPKVQDAKGRKGQILSFLRHTRECRVAWLDATGAEAKRGEIVPLDQLSLR